MSCLFCSGFFSLVRTCDVERQLFGGVFSVPRNKYFLQLMVMSCLIVQLLFCLFTYSFCLFLQPEETRLISDTSGIFKPEVVAKKILQDTMVNLPTSYHMLVLSCPNFMKLLHNLRITESMVPFNFDDFHLCFCISMGGGCLEY